MMIHKIILVGFAFRSIKDGKNIEVRLNDDDTANIMNKFYTREEQDKYGVIGIQIKLIDLR